MTTNERNQYISGFTLGVGAGVELCIGALEASAKAYKGGMFSVGLERGALNGAASALREAKDKIARQAADAIEKHLPPTPCDPMTGRAERGSNG